MKIKCKSERKDVYESFKVRVYNHQLAMKSLLLCAMLSFTLLILKSTSYSQVAGLSNSKVGVLSTDSVEPGQFEFEAAFDVQKSRNFVTVGGEETSLDGAILSSGMGVRMTAGFDYGIEAGLSFPVDVSSVGGGIKWRFLSIGNKTLAFMGGAELITESGFIPSDSSRGGSYTGGIIFGYSSGRKMSIDADFSMTLYTADVLWIPDRSFVYDLGIGYMLTDALQTVVEIAVSNSSFTDSKYDNSKSTLTSGYTFKINDAMLVVMGVQFDFKATNDYKGKTFLSGFTFTID